MNAESIQGDNVTHLHPYKKVHHVLAHSYFIYLLLFIVGFSLDLIFHINLSRSSAWSPLGVAISVFGSVLVLWAQSTSRTLKKENLTKEDFLRGPYCYTRSPTHLGLFLLILGSGIIANAFFIILCSVISFFVTKFTLLKKQEEILLQKYGTPYAEYGKMVRF